MRPFPDLDPSPDLPGIERGILDRWEENGTFQKSIDARRGAEEFIFYDGPPFANGLPHYGHLLTGYVKDAVPRYQTMRGKVVPRRFGWDCHGLPPEMEAERELGLAGRAAIIEHGVERFNDYCRRSVQRYTEEWHRYVTRQARWVDFEHDYRTMDLPYMESVMWAFKTLHDKGLIYEGYKVLPYCWECETPLSNFETKMDDSYRDRADPAVTVGFRLNEPLPVNGQPDLPTQVLAWTTTPWTLPSNLALTVGPDVSYAVIDLEGVRYLIGAGRLESYERELGAGTVVGTVTGADLIGRTYVPLLPYFASHPGAFVILGADWVTDEDGTGVVHTAPGFGEDDKAVCDAAGIAVVAPVDDQGCFTAEVTDFAGEQVFEANRGIIRRLAADGALVREDTYVHSYPHCWRTDTPLIYRALSSWFVEVTAFKDRLLELNEEITWVPPNVRDGAFGSWLAGARDWAISRNRFWGSPIPVWKSDDPAFSRVDVYGSLDEIERDFGVRPDDLHRPAIDQLTRPNPDDPSGASTMRRVTDVLDCWFESGSMPYAQVHYPFENKEWFEKHFPADFIVEYVGQTRGWFYTLHVLATALFDCPPFRSCIAHGIVLGSDGRKLSKRLRNYPDPLEAFDTYGSDAVRWAQLSSPVLRGGNQIATESAMQDALRAAVLPLWHACRSLTMYAEAQPSTCLAPEADLDRYLIAKAHDLVTGVQEAMDAFELDTACARVEAFLDACNNWWIRRSRDRLWSADQAAIDTLYTALEILLRTVAPLLPMTAEYLWTILTGGESVHLADWPDASTIVADPELVAAMDRVRDVSSMGHAVRKAERLRVRLPLAGITVAGPGAASLEPFTDILKDELNVKHVHLTDDVSNAGDLVLTVNPRVAGPRIGGAIQGVLKAAKTGDWHRDGDVVVVGGVSLEPGEYDLKLTPADGTTSRALPGDDAVVVVDTTLTPELEDEGTSRDVVRLVQEARKVAGLDVRDRIDLALVLPTEQSFKAATRHQADISREVLALTISLALGAPPEGPDLAGHGPVGIDLRVVAG